MNGLRTETSDSTNNREIKLIHADNQTDNKVY